jgi:Zn finger protein HypA/HybF involved in hydrogenase expression
MGRILLREERVTVPEKRLTNRRQISDRRAPSQPEALDQSVSPHPASNSLAGVICPKCGSARTASTAQVEDESHQLNLFRCETCHSRFVRATES